jgi:hypothetical protein
MPEMWVAKRHQPPTPHLPVATLRNLPPGHHPQGQTVNRTELAGHLSVSAETADDIGWPMWADLMREAAHMLKHDGADLHHLNEQLLNVRAELQMLQHVINSQ